MFHRVGQEAGLHLAHVLPQLDAPVNAGVTLGTGERQQPLLIEVCRVVLHGAFQLTHHEGQVAIRKLPEERQRLGWVRISPPHIHESSFPQQHWH